MKKCDCVLLCFAHSLLHFLSNQIVCVCVLTQYIHPSIYIERLVTVFLSIWISAVYLRTGLFMHNTAINVYEYSVNSFLALYSFLGIQLCELCTKSTFFHPLIKLIRSNGFVMQRFFLMSFLAHRLIFSTVFFYFSSKTWWSHVEWTNVCYETRPEFSLTQNQLIAVRSFGCR